jgi:hypothetical protein
MENQMDNHSGTKVLPTERVLEGASRVFNSAAERAEHIATEVRSKADRVVKDFNEFKMLPYDSVMSYFSAHHADDPRIVKGALIKERLAWRNEQVYQVYQVFLDKDCNLIEDGHGKPLGQKVVAESLDKELEAVFHGYNVVIVE